MAQSIYYKEGWPKRVGLEKNRLTDVLDTLPHLQTEMSHPLYFSLGEYFLAVRTQPFFLLPGEQCFRGINIEITTLKHVFR